MDQRNDIDELRKRLAQLEAANTQRKVFNQTQAARHLNMSVSKFRAEQNAGRINGRRRGRIWFFTYRDLQAYLDAE